MRVFIAIDILQKTKDNLERSARQFSDYAAKGRFTVKDNYHLTLHFLGNVAENDLIYVQSALDSVQDMSAPELSITQFATLRASNVVCAKFRKDEKLTLLHEKLGAKLEESGFNVEHRAYRPHVTIIRDYKFTLPFSEVTKNVDVYNIPFVADRINLYESVFGENGVTYRKIYGITLKS